MASLPSATLAAPPGAAASLQGGLPTRVVLGSVGIDAPVAEVGVVTRDGRSEWETAWQAAGHHMDSARPGQPGNMVLTGHISVADNRNLAAFATLPQVKRGDVVEVYVGDQVHRYEVNRVSVVPASAVKVLRSDHSPTVTLITCTPDLKSRIVVVGTLI